VQGLAQGWLRFFSTMLIVRRSFGLVCGLTAQQLAADAAATAAAAAAASADRTVDALARNRFHADFW
jgi:hypothetical protein